MFMCICKPSAVSFGLVDSVVEFTLSEHPPEFISLSHSHLKQRLQTLIPTEEELCLIKEAKAKSPNSPLAQAELCLLTLGQIPHLNSRLQLWAFALDYDSLERVGKMRMIIVFLSKRPKQNNAGAGKFPCHSIV